MTAPVEPSDPTKGRITAVSFAGSSGLNVDLSVDGGDDNDDYIGGFLQNISPDAIQEFVVRTGQFDADASRTNGGSVIISTKSGTDQWHWSGAGFFRQQGMTARNTLDNPAPSPKQPVLAAGRLVHARRAAGAAQALAVHGGGGGARERERGLQQYEPRPVPRARPTRLGRRHSGGDEHRRALVGAGAVPRPAVLGARRLGPVEPRAVVRPRRARPEPDHERSRAAGDAAVDRHADALALPERAREPELPVLARLARHADAAGQRLPSHEGPQRRPWLRARVSLQRDVPDDLGIRDLRRQPVRDADHGLPGPPRPAEVPVPLRPRAPGRPSHVQDRRERHPRAGAERRAARHAGATRPVPAQPQLLPRESGRVRRRLRGRQHAGARGQRELLAERPAAGALRAGCLAGDASADPELRGSLRHDVRPVHGRGADPGAEPRLPDAAGARHPAGLGHPARLPEGDRAARRPGLGAGWQREHGVPRRRRSLLQRPHAERLGRCVHRRERAAGRAPGPRRSGRVDRSALPDPVRAAGQRRLRAPVQRRLESEPDLRAPGRRAPVPPVQSTSAATRCRPTRRASRSSAPTIARATTASPWSSRTACRTASR